MELYELVRSAVVMASRRHRRDSTRVSPAKEMKVTTNNARRRRSMARRISPNARTNNVHRRRPRVSSAGEPTATPDNGRRRRSTTRISSSGEPNVTPDNAFRRRSMAMERVSSPGEPNVTPENGRRERAWRRKLLPRSPITIYALYHALASYAIACKHVFILEPLN